MFLSPQDIDFQMRVMFKDRQSDLLDRDDLREFFQRMSNKEITGADLNRLFSKHTFVKFLKSGLKQVCYDQTLQKHFYYQYKLGLNEDEFEPLDRKPKGLYVTVLSMAYKYTQWGSVLGRVTIPDDARVYIAFGSMKVSKLNLVSVHPMKNFLALGATEKELIEQAQGTDVIVFVAQGK